MKECRRNKNFIRHFDCGLVVYHVKKVYLFILSVKAWARRVINCPPCVGF
jgi:hypothetical protein